MYKHLPMIMCQNRTSNPLTSKMVKFGVVGCKVDPRGALNNDEFPLTGTGLLRIVNGTTVVSGWVTNLVVGGAIVGIREVCKTEAYKNS